MYGVKCTVGSSDRVADALVFFPPQLLPRRAGRYLTTEGSLPLCMLSGLEFPHVCTTAAIVSSTSVSLQPASALSNSLRVRLCIRVVTATVSPVVDDGCAHLLWCVTATLAYACCPREAARP